ncbi:lytic transglycosylase domain-containing protein [Flavobacterium aciduliphilum]|uniref:Transglycosylase-like protein with SLT domain n=1 Tax=Flavobacterium aciduliphilum TaxID=1101402 RepID=A0A328YRG8_9FLAO|nr:lytic transglycosylase domain-containing protein [Flavobacterium aciduliphilum]RAR75733.1 transglycosylase-like protein with SLT domain [Flavobacterium aciduliphilum]
MKKIKIIGGVAGIFLCCYLFVFALSGTDKKKMMREGTAQYFPAMVDFAGERTPLNIADVRERFDRELLVNANLHSSTILIMKRANRVFPVIEPILKQYGVPDDFKYLAVIESALTNAVSASGAKGVWQFMPETAKEKGMEVNDVVDERYHLQKATEAACKYLIKAKEKFGTWTLAAASYNGGMNGLNTKIAEQQVNDYYDLLLTDETSRYVFRILALKEIMQHPSLYGFEVSKDELYENIPTKTVEIDSSINDLAAFAKAQGINYKILKIHNPWLRDKKLVNPTKKKYVLEIPTEGY